MKSSLASKNVVESTKAMMNLLRDGKGRPEVAISRIRNEVDPSNFDRAIELLRSDVRWSRIYLHEAFPRELRELNPTRAGEVTSLRREIQWARAYLRPFSSELRTFAGYSNQFYSAVATGKVGHAEEFLRLAQRDFGQSLWLLKSRIFLAQITGGLESQKQLTRAFAQQFEDVRGIVPAILHFVSQRNEPSVTPTGLRQRLGQILGAPGISESLRNYITHHVVPIPGSRTDLAASLLYNESRGTIIDYYLALLHSLPCALADGKERTVALRTVVLLAQATGDRTMRFLCDWLMKECAENARASQHSEMVEAFLRGRYAETVDKAERLLERDPLNADALDYLSRARVLGGARAPSASSANSILSDALQSLLARDDRADRAAEEIEKTLYNWADTPIAAMVAIALAKFAPPNHAAGLQLTLNRLTYSHPCLSPERLADIDAPEDRRLYFHRLREHSTSALVTRYAEALATKTETTLGLEELVTERVSILKASISKDLGKIDEFERAASLLATSEHRFFRNVGVRWKAEALLKGRKLVELSDVIARASLMDPSVRPFLPIREFLDSINKPDRPILFGQLSFSVVLDLYSRHEGSEADDYRSSACQRVLRANNAQKPSQLKDQPLLASKEALYFLRYVCTEDVMETFLSFNSSQEVAEERLEVCNILKDLDPSSRGEYESEIREILRRLVVKRRMRDIDESKFTIDLPRVRANLPEAVAEAANRYIANRLLDGVGSQLMVEKQPSDEESGRLIVLPRNERLETLRTVLEGIRDEYVSSTAYGLDGVLSMNIRHGSLAAQLRNPLETLRLITRREDGSGKYLPNKRWPSASGDARVNSRIEGMLEIAAMEYDELIMDILQKWIRVKRNLGDVGLFDFTIDDESIRKLDAALESGGDYERLVAETFILLSERLEASLARIRELMAGTGKDRAIGVLTRLEAKLDALDDDDVRSIRAASTKCRTDLQHVFERVENWFRLSKGSISAPFYLDDAVYLSIASIRYLDPAFVVGVEIDRPDSYRFEGKHLVGVFYILQNALENIVKHAKGEGATGSVRVSGESTQIILRVQNKIDDSCLAETRQHVADAIAHLAVTGSGSLVGREGRSGLHKVRAILEEFGTEESLALVVLDGCIVEFSCRLPFRVNETSEFEVWPPLKH